MIDTIRLVVRDFEIDQKILRQRPSVQHVAYGTRTTNFKRLPEDGLTLSIFECCRYGKTSRGVAIELSVPKFIFGSNLFEVSDNHLGIFTENLGARLAEFGVITSAETLASSQLNRLDFCRNVPFKGDPSSYIASVAKVAKGYKTSTEEDRIKNIAKPDGHQLIVGNRSRRSTLYDKLTEASIHNQNKEAMAEFQSLFPDHGLIRIEHSLLKHLAVKRAMAAHGLNPILKDAWSAELSAKVLKEIFSDVFSNGVILDQVLLKNKGIDLELEALVNRIDADGLEKTLSDIKKSTSWPQHRRLRTKILDHLRDPPQKTLDLDQMSKYLNNFKPILNPPYAFNQPYISRAKKEEPVRWSNPAF